MAQLLRASRPLSWLNTALPFTAMALTLGGAEPGALVAGCAYFLLPYNLLLYGVNDIFDYRSDRLNPRKGSALEGTVVAPGGRRRIWLAIAVTNVPSLALYGLLAPHAAFGAVLAAVAAALVYSAPPLRLKEVAGLDSAISSSHFVLPALAGALLTAGLAGIPWRALLAFFVWGMASHALGAIQDLEYDRAAGIGSIAVTLGARAVAGLAGLLYIAAALMIASLGGDATLAAVALLPYALLAVMCLGGDPVARGRWAWRGFLGLNILAGLVIARALLQSRGLVHGDQLAQAAWLGAAAGLGLLLAGRLGMPMGWRLAAAGLNSRPLATTLALVAALVLADLMPWLLGSAAYLARDGEALAGCAAALLIFWWRRLAVRFRPAGRLAVVRS